MLKKLLAALAVIALLALVAFGVGSLRWWPSHRDGAPRLEEVARGAGPLLAGAAVVPLDPPGLVSVAGFPRLHWQEEGPREPVAARAVALREPGCTVVLASIEILLVPGPLERAIQRRVRDLNIDHLVVAATHTHAGPGGFWDDALGERLATGPYSDAIFEYLVDRTAAAIRQAVAAVEPAYLSAGRGSAPELVRNRGRSKDVDGRLVALRLDALAGHRIADLVVFPSHGTLLGLDNRRISGDWPGALMRGSEAPLLFFQGALGDQTPRIPERASSAPEAYAARVRAALAALVPSRRPPG